MQNHFDILHFSIISSPFINLYRNTPISLPNISRIKNSHGRLFSLNILVNIITICNHHRLLSQFQDLESTSSQTCSLCSHVYFHKLLNRNHILSNKHLMSPHLPRELFNGHAKLEFSKCILYYIKHTNFDALYFLINIWNVL